MPGDSRINSIEMRSLILEALAIEDRKETPRGETFKNHGYRGTIYDLIAIVEYLAYQRNLIDKIVEIPQLSWAGQGEAPQYKRNTNFNEEEQDQFSEQFHFLFFQNVISLGAADYQGLYGNEFPYFHVTKYGIKCIAEKEVLPYDPDKYMKKLNATSSINDWESFYIEQSILCYNLGAYESSIIMLGLASEYLATSLIASMLNFLTKNEPLELIAFQKALKGKTKISQEYEKYEVSLANISKKYPTLVSLFPRIDNPAKVVYSTFLRLTRNELAHPALTKMDKMECLSLLIAYVKYCQTQHAYLDFYDSNS